MVRAGAKNVPFFSESSREPKILVNYQYSFLRKEGTMKKINVPGDPKTWAVFLPDVSRR